MGTDEFNRIGWLMTQVLTNDQVTQMVQNTMVVLLARPDLKPEWHINLMNLLRQTRDAQMEDEMFFIAAVLTLLHSPGDTLATGTLYDHAWRTLLTALQTGVVEPANGGTEAVTVERLLQSVTQAVVTVMNDSPQHAAQLADEVREMRASAVVAEIEPLVAWLSDALQLLEGKPLDTIGTGHSGIFGEYWQYIVKRLT